MEDAAVPSRAMPVPCAVDSDDLEGAWLLCVSVPSLVIRDRRPIPNTCRATALSGVTQLFSDARSS